MAVNEKELKWMADKVIDSDYPKLQQRFMNNCCINCGQPKKLIDNPLCAKCRPKMAPELLNQIRRTSFYA